MNEQVESKECAELEVHNIGAYTFAQTGKSTEADAMGMREMQRRAFNKRDAQYLLIQAPPACGKSRALMFLALDKVIHQGLKKVIIAIPQLAIGSSFADTNLTANGFFADWKIDEGYNLCLPGGESGKVATALKFLKDPKAHYLLCSHPTLSYFFSQIKDVSVFDNCLIAVDEFHHVSEDADNRLGTVIHKLMTQSSAHIIAMTGSYFRGDSVPVLSPEDERRFEKVTYTYYEQLNGYKYLKSLRIDYAFYTSTWLEALPEILDLKKKTILHIPNVNSRESTGDKINEINEVFDIIGDVITQDEQTGIYKVRTHDGRILNVADLVNDIGTRQKDTQKALRSKEILDQVALIIALGMAKEGFDWPQCEVALTAGYRASLTEVVQIIGRATRDYPGKSSAQFINLLAQPSALLTDVEDAVNSLLKAITLSLLMEQVLAPNVHFRRRGDESPSPAKDDPNSIIVNIDDEHVSARALEIANNESSDIIEKVLNSSPAVQSAMATGGEGVMEALVCEDIAECIRELHPELSEEDVEETAKLICKRMIIGTLMHGGHGGEAQNQKDDQNGANDGAQGNAEGNAPDNSDSRHPHVELIEDNTAFVNVGGKFVNLDEIDFNLIKSINPFQDAYSFISKTVDAELLQKLKAKALAMREKMTEPKAMELWPYINKFVFENNRKPDLNSTNDFERRLAVALAYIQDQKRKSNAQKKAEAQA